jgi:hypothetical protein
MQISNSLNSPKIPAAADSTQSAARAGANSTPVLGPSTHTPAPELTQFVSQLRQIPELREEVVREVAQRLARGVYATPQALDRTVQAMLDSSMI